MPFKSKKSPKIRPKSITLEYFCPSATAIFVAGSFNNWSLTDALLKKDRNGNWKIKLSLPPGRYEYRYIVDGEWKDEQRSVPSVANQFGSWNSVLEV